MRLRYGSTVLLDLRFGKVQRRVARWEDVCSKVCVYRVRELPIQKDSKATGSKLARARKGMTAKPKLGNDPKQIAQRKAVEHTSFLVDCEPQSCKAENQLRYLVCSRTEFELGAGQDQKGWSHLENEAGSCIVGEANGR